MGTEINLDRFGLVFLFSALSLLPFIFMVVSSYVKIIVVMNLIRNALGVQQVPPNTVVNSMALILSMFVMAPVAQDTYDLLKDKECDYKNMGQVVDLYDIGKKPTQGFLMKNSGKEERLFFVKTAKALWPKGRADNLTEDSMLVLIPAFLVTELTSAFQIGFLLYLPFIIVDLVVSNILLALGMMMVSPMTISLPFKLLLFVLVDGWSRLIHNLVLTYR